MREGEKGIFEEEGYCVVITGRGLVEGIEGGGMAFESVSTFADVEDVRAAEGDLFSLSLAAVGSGFVDDDEPGGSLPGGGDVGIDVDMLCYAELDCWRSRRTWNEAKMRVCAFRYAVE